MAKTRKATRAKKAATRPKQVAAKPKPKRKAAAKPKQKPADGYAPFTINAIGDTVRLSFFDWEWLEKKHGSIEIDGYYMNGPGVEGLVRAVMFANDIPTDEIEGDSEGDACLLYFTQADLATRVAHLAAAVIKDRAQLAKTIEIARDQGFED